MKAALLIALALAAAAPIQAPKPDAPKAPPPKVSLPPPVRPPVTDALKLCRTTCSRSYYFCLAQNDAETCQPSWQTCRSNCVRANP